MGDSSDRKSSAISVKLNNNCHICVTCSVSVTYAKPVHTSCMN